MSQSSDTMGRQMDNRLLERLSLPPPRTTRPTRNFIVTPDYSNVQLDLKCPREMASCCFHPDKMYEVGRLHDQDPTQTTSRFARDLYVPESARVMAPTTRVMGLEESENFRYT